MTRNNELCDQVIAEDEQIDTLEKQVDQDGVGLLVRFHPVASDMRQVVSAMKVSTNLERIGDQSVTIARRAKRLNSRFSLTEVALLEPPYRLALGIFHDSIRAFAESDCTLTNILINIPLMRSLTKEAAFRRKANLALVTVAVTGLIGAGINVLMAAWLPKV